MRHSPIHGPRFFFATTNLPCPYLEGQVERRVVTELVGRNAVALHDQLSLAGFRRSHGIVYAPACPFCQACMAVRIVVRDFKLSRSQRRVLNRNGDLTVDEVPPVATTEQYQMFDDYQKARHSGGDMAKMDFFEYQSLIEETPVKTFIGEFRDPDQQLMGAVLTDHVQNGLSAVYSFFRPEEEARSLGTQMILWLITQARARGLDYVYLGYWVKGSSKMAYKAKFQPLEMRTPKGWEPLVSGTEPAKRKIQKKSVRRV